MKNNVSLQVLLALGQLAAVGHTLDTSSSADGDVECFAFDPLVDEHKLTFNTNSACSYECAEEGHSVFAVQGSGCFCLASLPPDDKKADPSKCDESCPGFPADTCGGLPGYYTVGTIPASYFNSSDTTNTTSTPSESVTATTTSLATTTPSSPGVFSNSTTSVTTPSSSASGSSASASSTVDTSNAAAPIFETSLTAALSIVCTVALLAGFI